MKAQEFPARKIRLHEGGLILYIRKQKNENFSSLVVRARVHRVWGLGTEVRTSSFLVRIRVQGVHTE